MMSGRALVLGREFASGGHVIASLLALTGSLLMMAALQGGLIDDVPAYIGLSCVVLGYCTVQTVLAYREEGRLILINPAVSASMIASFFQLVIGNMIWFLPDRISLLSPGYFVFDHWTNYYLALWTLGFVGLWIGYRSQWARNAAARIATSRVLGKLLRPSGSLRWSFVILLVGVSLVCRILQIWLGIYGYTAAAERLEDTAGFRQYLTMGADAGRLAVVAVALGYYSMSGPRTGRLMLLVSLIAVEVYFGLLTGFKSQVVMPVVLVGLIAFLVTGRLPKSLIISAVCLLVLAYALIEPFRDLRSEDTGDKYGFAGLGETILSARDTVASGGDGDYSFDAGVAHFVGTRLGIGEYSRGLEYDSENPTLPEDAPRFLEDIFLAPIMSLIPRIIWPDKPSENQGGWYSREVMGVPGNTSIGMSAVTYLYFAGGAVAVFVGFLVFGILQRLLFYGLLAFGTGGLLVFLGLSEQIRGLDSIYYSYIVNLIRMLPILVIAQYLLLKPASARAK